LFDRFKVSNLDQNKKDKIPAFTSHSQYQHAWSLQESKFFSSPRAERRVLLLWSPGGSEKE
jgi:hypothetical protein